MNPILESLQKTFSSCLEIAKKKNADYATGEDPFKNLRSSEIIGVAPEKAILVRMMDKMSRISNLLNKPPAVVDESIQDTLMDLCNYSALLIALLESKKG
jgi:hypothetical protein